MDSVFTPLRPPPKSTPGVNDMFNAWEKAFPPASEGALECAIRARQQPHSFP